LPKKMTSTVKSSLGLKSVKVVDTEAMMSDLPISPGIRRRQGQQRTNHILVLPTQSIPH
jgi:hypothetical protein